MTKHIGRKINIGIGKETTRGTAVGAAFWLPATEVAHEDKREYAKNEAVNGTIVDASEAAIVKRWAEGGFSSLIGAEHIGLVLYSLLGSLSSGAVSGQSGAYDHEITLQESAQHQSLTIGIDQPNGDRQFALAVANSLEIGFEKGKFLDYSVDFMSKRGVDASLSPSLVQESKFRPQDFEFKLADDLSGLAGASAIAIQAFDISFEKNTESDDVLGTIDPVDFLNKQFAVSGSFTLVYDNQTYEDMALDGTEKALQVKLQNTGVVIGSSTNPTITIQLAKCIFEEVTFSRGLNDIVTHTLNFKGLYSASDAEIGNIVVRNTTASY